jgi:hypothetical protein
MLQYLPSWPWYVFAIIALLIALISIFEGSYRLHREKVGDSYITKPLVSNIILLQSNGGEPLRIIFWCAETTPVLHIVLEYSMFVNSISWTLPRHIKIATFDYIIHGSRKDLLLMYREPNMDLGLHWGGPLKQGEPVAHIITGGIYRARVRFIGAKKQHHQNYYFLLSAFREHENNMNFLIFPHNDLLFVNEWELGKI